MNRLSYVQWQLVVTVVSVGLLFWTAARENVSGQNARWSNAGPAAPVNRRPKSGVVANSPKPMISTQQRLNAFPRRATSADRKPQDTTCLTATNSPAYDQKTRSWNSDSKTKDSPRSQTPTRMKPHLQEYNVKAPVAKSSDHSQMKSNDRQKKHNGKEVNTPKTNGGKAKFANHSSKSFKPQLEDIKSSYLLLNKTPIDRNVNEPAEDETKPITCNPLLNDNIRRLRLLEIKQKYKSRKFWNDSKYDKIEGLNWISWK